MWEKGYTTRNEMEWTDRMWRKDGKEIVVLGSQTERGMSIRSIEER